MADATYAVSEIAGTSPHRIDAVIENGVTKAADTCGVSAGSRSPILAGDSELMTDQCSTTRSRSRMASATTTDPARRGSSDWFGPSSGVQRSNPTTGPSPTNVGGKRKNIATPGQRLRTFGPVSINWVETTIGPLTLIAVQPTRARRQQNDKNTNEGVSHERADEGNDPERNRH
jgi:hypothetical protein